MTVWRRGEGDYLMANVGPLTVEVRIILKNRRALRALMAVVRCLDDVLEDMPWRDDVKRACRAARYAVKNLKCSTAVESSSGTYEDCN